MVSVDANVLVRFITRDDAVLSPRSRTLIASDEIFIAKTVVLETEWVLRSGYRYTPAQIEAALRGLAGLPNVTLEDPSTVSRALDWFAAGLDFADALHLASMPAGDRFATFDRDLLRRASSVLDAPEPFEP